MTGPEDERDDNGDPESDEDAKACGGLSLLLLRIIFMLTIIRNRGVPSHPFIVDLMAGRFAGLSVQPDNPTS